MAEETVSWSSLFGYFGESEAVSFVRARGGRLDALSEKKFLEEVAAARGYVSNLGSRGQTGPLVEPLPEGQDGRLEQIKTGPEFSEFVSGSQAWSFGKVELAKLRVYQPHINLEYATETLRKTPEPDDSAATLRFCLPLRGENPEEEPVVSYDPVQKTYSLASESPDMRVLGSVKLGYAENRMGVGFLYGFGHAELSVVQYRGLTVLMNGYHRAYALLKKGHRMVPCVVVKTDDFARTGMSQPFAFPYGLIASDRAPLMGDFLTRASVTAQWKRTRTILTVHAGVEIIPV